MLAAISSAPKQVETTKYFKASHIGLCKPALNKQNDFKRLVLFRNGITKRINDIMYIP